MSQGAAPSLSFATLGWDEGGLWLLDQTRLPAEEERLRPAHVDALVAAIRRLVVRGAPALGCAGAYGMALACRQAATTAHSTADLLPLLEQAAQQLDGARPTAVNLAVGVAHGLHAGRQAVAAGLSPAAVADAVLDAARAFHRDDQARCLALAEQGLQLLRDGMAVLTHCNAGALATGGLGTALAPLHLAAARGLKLRLFADETRPLRQGARLTAWEMAKSGLEVKVLPDGAAGSLLASGQVDLILVGADRIAANGDTANKVGTYPLAVLAARHQVPFHVVAPTTTIDFDCPSGADIPIEMRGAEELLTAAERQVPIGVYNPAFDMTPAALITSFVLENGLFSPTTLSARRGK